MNGFINIEKKCRIFVIAIIAILISSCMILTSCNEKHQSSNMEKYQIVIDQFNEALNKFNSSTDAYKSWGSGKDIVDGCMYGLEYVVSYGSATPNKYSFVDLDNDGIEELIISCESYILNIYSIVNDEIKLTFVGRNKSFATLREGNLLMFQDSGGYDIGNLNVGKYDVSQFSDSNWLPYSKIEGVMWSGLNYRSQDKVKITLTDSHENVLEEKVASFNELQEIQANFQNKYKENNTVQWIYFGV